MQRQVFLGPYGTLEAFSLTGIDAIINVENMAIFVGRD